MTYDLPPTRPARLAPDVTCLGDQTSVPSLALYYDGFSDQLYNIMSFTLIVPRSIGCDCTWTEDPKKACWLESNANVVS
ncbi:hypothetical protein Pmani_025987 [Petrolisthes manimaculis]|uniref:Uncharacterized protein n=1 Tax=Petrolisthes manimaculis TaxID=1843537 RepID=A0AAE1P6P0_9EUCA|nr:hypothetical protein Pmani_025987 [Petrolisthes manimaculis]